MFYILLTDFLSKNTDTSLLPGSLSALEQISKTAIKPLLTEHADELVNACDALQKWLQNRINVKIWLANLDAEITFQLSRQEIIYFAGNMSKHHFGHLTAVTKQLHSFLDDCRRPRHDIIPALENVYESLHNDILNYHASTVSELLNNVRWGIHSYLKPEYTRSYRQINSFRYKYDIPKEINTDFATACYWDLMNTVRSTPYIHRFITTGHLKGRH